MFSRRIQSKVLQSSLKARKQLVMNTNIAASVSGAQNMGRSYFTFMDRVKEAVRVPMKHMESYFEPQGKDYESQLPNTENLYGNTAMVFNAYLTHNAIDMNTWHDMDNTYHNQFGTVDNPVLIFTTDSSWRIVICQGPGVEDDSHAHEKMFYFLREGPMNRCQICGQCFKLVRLKDEYSEINDYYSYMFSSLTHFDVTEDDMNIPLHQLFGDRPHPNMQSQAATNVYIHVNPDEADHMLVDPAYKLERLKDAHEKLEAMLRAYYRVDKESQLNYSVPIATSRMIYSNWFEIEKSIRRLDRLFLKVEKFNARQFIDRENHERREQRMLARKRDRWTDNYTYFFGGLTEEEQMYRDYFQTDLEDNPENEKFEELQDEVDIANTGQFTFDKYDFIETSLQSESHESFMDIVEEKIYKYKYRLNNDSLQEYGRKMDRVMKRSLERAKNRSPEIEVNLNNLFEQSEREMAIGPQLYYLSNNEQINDVAKTETKAIREYMVEEALMQYKDYYESDEEEHPFFEYIDELPHRDRIKFIEMFEDFTISKDSNKGYVKIPKREYNPELSYFSNVALDLIDFKDRVHPLANDAARLDATHRYQRLSVDEVYERVKKGRENYNKFLEAKGETPIDFQGHRDLTGERLLSSEEHHSEEHHSHHAAEEVEEHHEEHEHHEKHEEKEDEDKDSIFDDHHLKDEKK